MDMIVEREDLKKTLYKLFHILIGLLLQVQ